MRQAAAKPLPVSHKCAGSPRAEYGWLAASSGGRRRAACQFLTLCVGEESSESCLLLLPIAKNSVELLKEKVLILFEDYLIFLQPGILRALANSRLGTASLLRLVAAS